MKLTITALALASAGLASAQFNNDNLHLRVFNDAPSSVLTATNNFPTSVEFNESALYNPSGFANRHIWDFSPDGALDSTFGTSNYWSASFDINMSATGPSTLDKEAGFILGNTNTGDSQFIVKADGEVAMFGGAFTFHDFFAAGSTGDYQLGTTAHMSLHYFNNGSANMMTAAFTYNGTTTSFTDATNINSGTLIGGYAQYQITNTNGIANTGDTVFGNIQGTAAPEPATMAALGLGALCLLRRRKRS